MSLETIYIDVSLTKDVPLKRDSKKNNKSFGALIEGIIKRHPDGFGFFIPDNSEHPDVFIPASSMQGAMTNDRVTVRPEKERDGRFKGEIIRINSRSQKKIAGKFIVLNEKYGVIKDEGKGWGQDLKIQIKDSLNAKNNELVAAEITQYPESGNEFLGKVVEIIGDLNSALNDIRRVIINQNVPDVFSQDTLIEAKKFGTNPTEAEFKNRKDLRHIPIITIDGATAKDFDDAVFTEIKPNGFHLYVAIADVSHYVKPGSAIDKDAYERGTSVYFPNFVVPMLPEALSNGLCSLNPHVPRLALVAEMNFDFEGQMMNSNFFEAVIESQARVTYGEAQEVVDGVEIQKFSHVKENILRCADLAKVLMARRFKEGSLDLEVPETELIIDGTGEPIDIIKSERLFAHRLIEELMLAANVAVAKYLSSKEIPSLYRVHEPPDPMKMSLLQKFIGQLGSKANFAGDKLQKKLTRALQEFANKPEASVVHILTLRSMSQAKYTIENLGHFGLGFDFYTHFTSPIRRYPDLIVHRLIKNQIGVNGYRLIPAEDIETAGTWLSACEQRSAKSERQIQAIKKARFMKKMVGESFDGMISSITKFGFFVQLKQYNVDGLVRLEDLGTQNSWVYDEENLKLVSKKSGFSYSMGDLLRVTVSLVDIEQGQINFVLEGYEKQQTKPNRETAKTFRKKSTPDVQLNKTGYKPKPQSEFNKPTYKAKPQPEKKSVKKSLRLRSLEKISDPIINQETKQGSYEVKPRYKSLSDFLEKNLSQKNTNKTEDFNDKRTNDRTSKPGQKLSTGASENRKNSKKRSETSSDSGRFGKTRSSKFSRKNKSR